MLMVLPLGSSNLSMTLMSTIMPSPQLRMSSNMIVTKIPDQMGMVKKEMQSYASLKRCSSPLGGKGSI